MGSIRPKGKDKWEIVASLGWDPKKKRYGQKTQTVSGGKRVAERALARLETEIADGRHRGASGNYGQLLDEWLEHSAASLKDRTLAEYQRLVEKRIKPALGDVRLSKLDTRMIDSLYCELEDELAPRSVRQIHAVIRRSLAQGCRWGYIAINPALLASPPKIHAAELMIPTVAEVGQIIAAAEKRDKGAAEAMRIAVALGCRRGELCGLQWQDIEPGRVFIRRSVIDIPEVRVTTPKSHTTRAIPVDERTIDRLTALRCVLEERAVAHSFSGGLVQNAFVFSPEADGRTPLNPAVLTRRFIKAAEDAKIDGVRFHDLRHLHISLLLAAGVPLAEVSQRAGHAKQSTTSDIYSHIIKGAEAQAPAMVERLLGGVIAA